MGPGADLFLAVHRPHAEEDLTLVAARDFRMADDLPPDRRRHEVAHVDAGTDCAFRSEEHTSELQSLAYLVCRLLLEKKKSRWVRRGTLCSCRVRPARTWA